MLQYSDNMESFTNFQGCLAMTFSGHRRSGKTDSHTAVVEVSSCVIWEESGEHRWLSNNSRQRQNKIYQQASHINSLEAQNKKLGQLLEPKVLVETITQAVASSLKMDKTTNPNSSPNGFISKPYLGKLCPSQLTTHVDGSLDPSFTCQYCKDTGHLKENCVRLTQWLAWNNQETFNGGASKPPKKENWSLLQLRTRLQDLMKLVLINLPMRRNRSSQFTTWPFWQQLN